MQYTQSSECSHSNVLETEEETWNNIQTLLCELNTTEVRQHIACGEHTHLVTIKIIFG